MVKIDTKADFWVFQLLEDEITEIMSDKLEKELNENRLMPPGNIIIKLSETIQTLFSEDYINALKKIQTTYLENHLSFILTEVKNKDLKKQLEEKDINFTPSLSEAVDMVMMEKLERDLLGPE